MIPLYGAARDRAREFYEMSGCQNVGSRMNTALLRRLLHVRIIGLSQSNTHRSLTEVCDKLGLPPPGEGSKRERMQASFDAVRSEDLPNIATRLLEHYPPSARVRNQIQDILWENTSPPIPKRFRREIARTLETEDLYIDARRFDEMLQRLWVLEEEDEAFLSIFTDNTGSLRAEIDRHVYRNPGDWTTEYLFDRLGVYEAADRRVALFLEGLASADVRPDERSQRRFVQTVNRTLQECGLELRETGSEGGYPTFALVAKHAGIATAPKNLVFASSLKPDIRFRDAINNDIQIVTNADKVLVYDRPISASEGLRWCDLQEWWSTAQGIQDDQEAKSSLYSRLKDSLPEASPAQRLLFDSFYRGFGSAVPDLPALLPEVWLHWDPKTVRERGAKALLAFRMDFLLLLPHGVRVVVEVDGKHHYARGDGKADPIRYAKMTAADRDLQLAGYHVYRFGVEELQGDSGRAAARAFFQALFKKFGVI